MTDEDLRQYARLLVQLVNVQPDQNLHVRGEPCHWPLFNAIAEAAYAAGARYVDVSSQHAGLHKARVENSKEEHLEYVPRTLTARNDIFIDEQWALISVKNPEDPDFLSDLDSTRNAEVLRALAKANSPLRRNLQADKFQWIVAASPTDPWARKVLGEDATGDTLWETMRSILRLDTDDPLGAWTRHAETLASRSRTLQSMEVDSLHFTGPGTDLRVGLPERPVWLGGSAQTPDGTRFLPNVPTEEVFTTPDYRRTSGEVQVTRPVFVMGSVVDGAWFRFDEGRVVDFGARSGEDILGRYLEMDEGARYLGEVALVDGASPIFQAGRVFYDILYDENAACHIALGGAYPGGIQGGDELSESELTRAGGNISDVHTDFMVGSEEITVTARLRDGRDEVPVIDQGRFVI
jgi:aminopeptidase